MQVDGQDWAFLIKHVYQDSHRVGLGTSLYKIRITQMILRMCAGLSDLSTLFHSSRGRLPGQWTLSLAMVSNQLAALGQN